MRYDGNDGPYTIDPKDIGSYLREEDITEEAIKDKSKGDGLSKGFAILQTGWFILQCIARKIQALPMTELEIITLAFATLNFATYTLWWNKPLDVQVPFIVRDELGGKGDTQENADPEDIGWDMFKRAVTSMWVSAIKTIRKLPGARIQIIYNVIVFADNVPGIIATTIRDMMGHPGPQVESWVKSIMGTACCLPIFAAVCLLFIAFLPFIGILAAFTSLQQMGGVNGDLDKIEPKSKRVPTFYSGKLKHGERNCALFVVTLIATIFGAIHSIAWSFQFPSPTEQLLWRISSLAITSAPVLILGFSLNLTIELLPDDCCICVMGGIMMFFSFLGLIALSILYILARVTLLVLAFTSLRSLPPNTYRTVNWTTFIPHI